MLKTLLIVLVNVVCYSLILFSVSRCGSLAYMGSNEPVTRMECEIQHFTKANKDPVWYSVKECKSLPETLF